MRRQRLWGAISAAGLVVVGGVAAAFINELHGGWQWWVLAGVAVLGWAAGTGWLYLHDHPDTSGSGGRVRVREGGIYTSGSVTGGAKTRTRVRGSAASEPDGSAADVEVGAGGVFADGDIAGGVRTDTGIDHAPGPTGTLDRTHSRITSEDPRPETR